MEIIDVRTTEDFVKELYQKVSALELVVSNLEDDIELLKDAVGDLENKQ